MMFSLIKRERQEVTGYKKKDVCMHAYVKYPHKVKSSQREEHVGELVDYLNKG